MAYNWKDDLLKRISGDWSDIDPSAGQYDWKKYLLKKLSGDWSDITPESQSSDVVLSQRERAMMKIAELIRSAKPGVDRIENVINMAKSIGGLDEEILAHAEKSGEIAQESGGKPSAVAGYLQSPVGETAPSKLARDAFPTFPSHDPYIPGYDKDEFRSALDRYVADELRYPEEEAERRANSVNIDIPGGYESLQRIRQQAGGKPGGGSFSVMGGSLTGGDTEQDMRRYVEEAKRNQLDIKIATIEASAPAKYRSPATNQYLDMLYKQKAEEEKSEVDAMNAAANMRQSEANITQSNAYAEYYGGRNAAETEQESIKALADIEIEKIKTKGDLMVQFKDLLATLGGDPVKGGNPQLYVQVLKAIGMAPTPQQAYEDVLKLIGGTGLKPGAAGLEEADKNLFMTP